jgi:Ni/Co efflux regulator RcnB
LGQQCTVIEIIELFTEVRLGAPWRQYYWIKWGHDIGLVCIARGVEVLGLEFEGFSLEG